MPQYEELKQAVLNGNEERLLTDLFSPDVEFYHKDKVIRYKIAPRLDFLKGVSEVRQYTFSEQESLKAFFTQEVDTEVSLELRLIAGVGTFPVLKFPNSKILREMVFTVHAGQWKVYEVAVRNNSPV